MFDTPMPWLCMSHALIDPATFYRVTRGVQAPSGKADVCLNAQNHLHDGARRVRVLGSTLAVETTTKAPEGTR